MHQEVLHLARGRVGHRHFYQETLLVNFRVRRRKWYDNTTGEYFTNSYDTTYKGTRYSLEFAAFLKARPGDISPIGPFA